MTTAPAETGDGNRLTIGRTIAALALALLSLTTWALASPVGSSPDDDFHIANIYCLHDSSTCRSDDVAWPEDYIGWSLDVRDRDLRVYGIVKDTYPDLWQYPYPRELPCYIRNGGVWVSDDATQPADCLNAEDPADNSPASLDSIGYYPSLNYRLLSLFTQDTIRESVVAWRLVTILLIIALAAVSLALSQRAWRRPLAVSWLVASMPVGMFLFASHNPSALAVAATAASVGPGVALLREPWRPREQIPRVAFLLICALLTVGGRNEGLGYAAMAAIVIVILGMRGMSRGPAMAIGGLIVGATLLVLITGLWRQPLSQLMDLIDPNSLSGAWDALAQAGKSLSGSYYTALGWLEIVMPHSVTVPAAAAFWGVVAVGVGAMSSRKAAAIVGAVIILIAFPLAVEATTGRGIQARYYLPLTFLLVIAAVSPVAGKHLSPSRFQWWGLAASLIIANTIALLWVTVRFVRGIGAGTMSPPGLAEAGVPQWWWDLWLSPFWNWIVGSLSYLGLVVVLLPLLNRAPNPVNQGEDEGQGPAPESDPTELAGSSPLDAASHDPAR